MKEWVLGFLSNKILIAACLAWILAQGFKIISFALIHHKLDWRQIFASGGMPSSHTSTVSALSVGCLILYGPSSALFAIAFCVMCIVMYDAAGVRRQAGEQASLINLIVEEWEKQNGEITDKTLKEIIGHTPLEVVCGFICGVIIALIICL